MTSLFYSKITVLILIPTIVICCFILFPKKRKELALLFLSITLSILTAEIVLRLFYPQIMEHDKMFEYDPELGWKFIPDNSGSIVYYGEVHHYIETNSIGFRDHASAPDKENKKKILVLGDSFVSNISVKENDVFTEVMEHKLTTTEVLNFGVNGYSLVQEYLSLKKWFDKINPDIIILVIYIRNDFTENIGNDWLYERPYVSLEKKDSILTFHKPPKIHSINNSESAWRFYRKSHLYTLMDHSLINLSMLLKAHNDSQSIRYELPESYLCRTESSAEFHSMRTIMEKLLLTISNFAIERKVPLVTVIAPSIVQVDDDLWSDFLNGLGDEKKSYTRSLPNDKLMEFAKKNHIKMIDLLLLLQSENRKGEKLYNPKEQHWTKAGNRVVANALIDYLRLESLIE